MALCAPSVSSRIATRSASNAWGQHVPLHSARHQCMPARRGTMLRVLGDPSGSAFDAFEEMDQQMAQMQRQMDSMFPSMFGDMQRMQERMDREMDSTFADVARLRRQIDADVERSIAQARQQSPQVHVERREERGSHSYRYYESIHIHSGPAGMMLTPTASPPASMFSPLLFVAMALTGAYVAASAAFLRNFDLTTYSRTSKFKLLVLWPFLTVTSKRFREQFVSALRGIKVTAKPAPEGGDGQGPQQA